MTQNISTLQFSTGLNKVEAKIQEGLRKKARIEKEKEAALNQKADLLYKKIEEDFLRDKISQEDFEKLVRITYAYKFDLLPSHYNADLQKKGGETNSLKDHHWKQFSRENKVSVLVGDKLFLPNGTVESVDVADSMILL